MKHSISYQTVSFEAFWNTDQTIAKINDQVEHYIDLLFWWNEKVNLISRDVSRETIREHIRHSLLLAQLSPFNVANKIIDAGSGGGLPGIPLAMACRDKEFVLNDIVSKKILAARQIIRELSLSSRVKTADKSIGSIRVNGNFLLVSKHAFKIPDLYKLVDHLPWTSIVFYKSIDIMAEVEKVTQPLNITVHKLFPNSNNSFYKGKGIIIIERPVNN